jgi:hypothetical protein
VAQFVFKYESCKGSASLCVECTPFRPGSQRAVGLDNVAIARCVGHEHSIDIGFMKQWHRSCNCGWDVGLSILADLALMAGSDVPLHIMGK